MEVNIHQAKTHLSRLLQRVAAGEEVTIARAGVPIARLVTVKAEGKTRPLGFARGEIWISDDFDAPLPDDLLKEFYGGEIPPIEPSNRKRSPKSRKRR
jgi:prevent-host-death family protein